MSAILFHSEEKTTHLRGSERAYGGYLCSKLMLAVLDVGRGVDENHWIRNVIPDGHYLLTSDYGPHRFKEALEAYLSVDGKLTTPDDAFCISLNTALVSGSDPLKLLARLHGQCEIHCFVEGQNRAWLADIMAAGRECGMYRDDAGWESVIEHLHTDSISPVVCSYTVCDGFPNPYILNTDMSEDEQDAWYDKPVSDQWEQCMAVLRSDRLELRPDNWNDFYFGKGINAFTLKDHADPQHTQSPVSA